MLGSAARTPYGRVTTYDAPLDGAERLVANGGPRTCLSLLLRSAAGDASASAVPGKRALRVTLTLTNPSRHDLWILPATFADETVTEASPGHACCGRSFPPAGGTASVTSSAARR